VLVPKNLSGADPSFISSHAQQQNIRGFNVRNVNTVCRILHKFIDLLATIIEMHLRGVHQPHWSKFGHLQTFSPMEKRYEHTMKNIRNGIFIVNDVSIFMSSVQ
jgi:hypothetical protein